MSRAARGEADCFGALVGRYQNALLNFFRRQGVTHADAEDLVQRAFLRVWNYRDRWRPEARFTTFLFFVANQVKIDFFRAEGRRRTLEDGFEEVQKAEGAARVRPGAEAAPCAGEDVRAAVAKLPEGLRDVVELGVFQDLPYAEVSEILGIPAGTVKSRMFNALRKLKELMT